MHGLLPQPAWKSYPVSVLCVAVAVLPTLAVRPLFDDKTPIAFFALAVILSAAYGGLGPGLLATSLSALLLFLQPEMGVAALAAHASAMVLAVIGVACSIAIQKLRSANASLSRTLRDKDHMEAVNEELFERTEILSQANEELERFAYTVAHDLAAPLRGISLLTELLIQRNQENFKEDSKECARMIVSDVQRMHSMIQGLLDYTIAVRDPSRTAAADCGTAVGRVLQDLRVPIEASGAVITFDSLPAVPMNEEVLVRVFTNLIGNAIKYRGDGRPRVHISVEARGNDWTFCVADDGIGLDMKHADEIFGMFKRLHGPDHFEGNGIGLALCKAAIERHGGKIWVESEPGKGSKFLFTLPAVAAPELIRKPTLPAQTHGEASRAVHSAP